MPINQNNLFFREQVDARPEKFVNCDDGAGMNVRWIRAGKLNGVHGGVILKIRNHIGSWPQFAIVPAKDATAPDLRPPRLDVCAHGSVAVVAVDKYEVEGTVGETAGRIEARLTHRRHVRSRRVSQERAVHVELCGNILVPLDVRGSKPSIDADEIHASRDEFLRAAVAQPASDLKHSRRSRANRAADQAPKRLAVEGREGDIFAVEVGQRRHSANLQHSDFLGKGLHL